MKTMILFGSPRKKGNTISLLRPFLDELKKAGSEIEFFDVYESDIAGCRACFGCQKDKKRSPRPRIREEARGIALLDRSKKKQILRSASSLVTFL